MTQQNYKTTDMNFAIVLHASGIKLEDIKKNPRHDKQMVFVFENDLSLEALRNKYISGELRMEPRELFASYRFLKSLIRDNF